jgi:hypothetical protein
VIACPNLQEAVEKELKAAVGRRQHQRLFGWPDLRAGTNPWCKGSLPTCAIKSARPLLSRGLSGYRRKKRQMEAASARGTKPTAFVRELLGQCADVL